MKKTKLNLSVFILLSILFSSNIFAQSNFIQIENGNFSNGKNAFRPYSVNYVVRISQNCVIGNYFIEPSSQYSNIWGYPHTIWEYPNSYSCDDGRNYYSDTDEQGVGLQKLNDDMEYLRNKGFNVIRIAGIGPFVDPITDQVLIPTGSYDTYYTLVGQLLNIIGNHGMKAIVNLGINSNIKELKYYCEFLERFSSQFKNNTTIMAYSLLSEPFYGFHASDCNDKILIGNWVNEMYYSIKRNDNNHLVTIGLQHPETVTSWDYGMMMVDFMSLHLYAWSADVNYSNRMMSKYYKFMSDNYDYSWIIAETGFSGTDDISQQDNKTGTEQDQFDFANYNIQKAQDYGCLGYGWWAHQDLGFGSNWENNLGFITRWPEQREKMSSSAFNNMQNIVPNHNNCTTPINYLNIDEGTAYQLSGNVRDENGNPIKNAVIYGLTSSSGNFRALTNGNGDFTFYTNGQYPYSLRISGVGYNAQFINNPQNAQIYTLRKINKNNWTKRYTNNNNNTLLDWIFHDYDRFIPCDFDGDGKDELFCIQKKDGGGAFANIYGFDNGKWTRIWSNSGNNVFGGWSIRSSDKYFGGDFDGDGKDEIQCLQLTSGSHNWSTTLRFNIDNGTWSWSYSNEGTSSSFAGWWLNDKDDFIVGDFDGDGKDEILCYQKNDAINCYATMLNFDNNTWNWGWSNYGNDWIGGWRLSSTDKLYSGDIDGDQKDELICAQTGGNHDWITIQNFDNDSWNTLWSNYGNNTVGIYPYRNKLVIGNFDFDDKDEILGIYTWATKFDFDNGSLNWSWSTGASTLSDWNINYNANCFFMHTIEKAPDYLFTIEEKNNSYSAEMFSMNVLVEGNSFLLKSGKINEQNLNKKETSLINVNTITVYPNPAQTYFNVTLPENQTYLIYLININGKLLKTFKNVQNQVKVNCVGLNAGVYFLRIISSEKNYQHKIVITK